MKLSVVLFVVLVASACANDEDAARKHLEQTMKKCAKESGTTIAELEKCHKEKKVCPKVNCFEACMMKEDGLLNKDGTINTKVIEQFVSALAQHGHPKTAAAVKKCCKPSAKKMSFCDVAHAINVCLEKEPHD